METKDVSSKSDDNTCENGRSYDNHGKRIGIFVIAYNAESHIGATLKRIPTEIWDAIEVLYIVDDCSMDDTVEYALGYEKHRNKIKVLRNRVNRRYGGNQKYGYQYAIDQKLDVVIMLHADGQYSPEMLPQMLDPLVQDDADVVFGSRMIDRSEALKGGMPKYKYFGNIILTQIENTLSGMNLSEYHSGFRAYKVDFLRSIPFWENSDEWHFDTQILLQAKQLDARIVEVPIPTYYGNEICHVNGMLYGLNCILSASAYWLYRKGIFYSRIFDVNIKGRRYFEKFDDPGSSHSLIWSWLQDRSLKGIKILELGVGDASLTKRLHEAGAEVTGVDIDEEAAEIARPYCEKLLISNLDDFESVQLEGVYDMVIAADVLEHLRDPEVVLSKLKRFVKRDGWLVVSLPNVVNLYVRLNVLLGRFPYHSKGILDRTHLHFYTLKSAESMLKKTGWHVGLRRVSNIPIAIIFPFLLRQPFVILFALFRMMTKCLKGLLGYQSIFFCQNPNQSKLL